MSNPNSNFRRLRQKDTATLATAAEVELLAYQRVMQNLHEQLSWTRRQLNYVAYNVEYRLAYELRRGEVYEFDWGLNVHAELSHRHYGVVLIDSYANNDIAVVIPLKSRHHEPNPVSDVNLGVLNHIDDDKETLAVVNQIRGIDKLRIYQRGLIKDGRLDETRGPITILTEAQMKRITDALGQLFVDGRAMIS